MENGSKATDAEWRAFLEMHLARHPSSRAQDIYKLLHQACYGPGHIIEDEAMARDYLYKEWDSVEPDDGIRLLEPLDPRGLTARLHLAPAKASGVTTHKVADAFLGSARRFRPSGDFKHLWKTFRKFAPDENLAELDKLAKSENPPPVHHSRALADAEKPHYRVVLADVALGILAGDPSF